MSTPRFVRNFWLSLTVDGRSTTVETGPASKDGGFFLEIKVRENGGISPNSLYITGRVSDGQLILEGNRNGKVLFTDQVER